MFTAQRKCSIFITKSYVIPVALRMTSADSYTRNSTSFLVEFGLGVTENT